MSASRTQAEEVADLRIRRSTAADKQALERLAQLDGVLPPAGGYIVAEEGGVLRAALPLDGGPAFADPFHPTADLVAMLSLRAERLAAPRPERPRRGLRVRAAQRVRAPAIPDYPRATRPGHA